MCGGFDPRYLSEECDVKSPSTEHVKVFPRKVEAMVVQGFSRDRGGPNPLNGVLKVFLSSGGREEVRLRECFQDRSCSVSPNSGTKLELVDVIILPTVYLGYRIMAAGAAQDLSVCFQYLSLM